MILRSYFTVRLTLLGLQVSTATEETSCMINTPLIHIYISEKTKFQTIDSLKYVEPFFLIFFFERKRVHAQVGWVRGRRKERVLSRLHAHCRA